MTLARTAPLQLSMFDQLFSPRVVALSSSAGSSTIPPGEPPTIVKAADHHLAAGRTLALSWRGRAQDNIEAIRLLNLIDREARSATPAEQHAIAKFVGFGASDLANKFGCA